MDWAVEDESINLFEALLHRLKQEHPMFNSDEVYFILLVQSFRGFLRQGYPAHLIEENIQNAWQKANKG